MFNGGNARGVGIGGSLNSTNLTRAIDPLLDEFAEAVKLEVESQKIRPFFVRSMFTCNIFALVDPLTLWVIAQKEPGIPNTTYYEDTDIFSSAEQIYDIAKWDLGFESAFVISFPISLLMQSKENRLNDVAAIAKAHVKAEVARVNYEMNIIQVNPIFGPAAYTLDPRLAFVLMPFSDELTSIYQTIVKPCIENSELELICRRADDLKTNRAIIQDIWKSICEARVIIADLTGNNPNVMYELGIAHTLGKETILIYQKKESELKIPFDLAHIRLIDYENNAVGGRKLEQDLGATLNNVLNPKARS